MRAHNRICVAYLKRRFLGKSGKLTSVSSLEIGKIPSFERGDSHEEPSKKNF